MRRTSMVIMASKKLLLLLLICAPYFIKTACAASALGQTLQINTNFTHIIGKPTWLLIIRDVQSGLVTPYMFDIRNNQNYWLAFTYGRSYRIVASTLTFNPHKIIHNFCNLENGILSGKSMFINLSGKLSTNRDTSKCTISRYND